MHHQLSAIAMPPLAAPLAAALWHVAPPSARRTAASAERLTAARSLRCWGTALACTGRSAWLPAAAFASGLQARVQVTSPHSGAVPSSLGLRLTRQSTGRAPASRVTPFISNVRRLASSHEEAAGFLLFSTAATPGGGHALACHATVGVPRCGFGCTPNRCAVVALLGNCLGLHGPLCVAARGRPLLLGCRLAFK